MPVTGGVLLLRQWRVTASQPVRNYLRVQASGVIAFLHAFCDEYYSFLVCSKSFHYYNIIQFYLLDVYFIYVP